MTQGISGAVSPGNKFWREAARDRLPATTVEARQADNSHFSQRLLRHRSRKTATLWRISPKIRRWFGPANEIEIGNSNEIEP